MNTASNWWWWQGSEIALFSGTTPSLFTKEATNQVIDGNTNASSLQSYDPSIVKVGSTYYCLYKSNNRIYHSTSTDLLTWSDAALVINLDHGGQGDDDVHCEVPYVLVDGTTYHMIYRGRTDTPSELHNIMYTKSTTSPISGYSAQNSGNAIITPSDVNTALTKTYTKLQPGCLKKLGATYYLFFDANDAGGATDWDVCMAQSTDLVTWTNITLLLDSSDHFNASEDAFWCGDVVYNGGKYVMTLTYGQTGFTDIINEMRLYLATADAITGPYTIIETPFAFAGAAGTWEERRLYTARWLVNQDGSQLTPQKNNNKYWLFYSGHSLESRAPADGSSLGQTGIGYVAPPTTSTLAQNAINRYSALTSTEESALIAFFNSADAVGNDYDEIFFWFLNSTDWLTGAKSKTASNSGAVRTANGATFNGTDQYIDLSWIPSSDGSLFVQDDAMIGCYVVAETAGATTDIFGTLDSNPNSVILQSRTSTNRFQLNSGANASLSSTSLGAGFHSIDRIDGTNGNYRKNAVIQQTVANSSTALPTTSIWLGCLNNNGSPAAYWQGTVGITAITNSIGFNHYANYIHMNTLLTSLGII